MTPSAPDATARLAAIVESSEDAIVSKDLNGVIQTWNAGAERVYGYNSDEMVGRPMQLLLPPNRQHEEDEILGRLRRGERVQHFETTRVRKDGEIIDVSLSISPVRQTDGRILGASHIARDITERKRFEQQLRQSQRLESLGVMAGGIAHDFNNLLTGILGNASIVTEILPSSNQGQPFLREIMTASQRLSDLTRQLLAYSGRGSLSIAALNISDLVREISALIQASIPKNVHIRMQLDDRLPPVNGDASQVQQIVMNLIINGAEAIPEGTFGSVLVSTGLQTVDETYIRTTSAPHELRPGPYVYLEVHDTGAGMTPETQAHIFDPFFTTKIKGRGLGLAAVLGIIQSHKGTIKVYSQPGKGSTFKVLLPATQDIVAQPPSSLRTDLRGTGTILVVDDEAVVRRVAKSALELYGYTVITAVDGADAIHIFDQRMHEIDLILLDLVMPNMGGEETYRHVHVSRPEVPVILSSGYSDSQAQERFAGKMLAGFIKKPYTASALGEVVQRVLRDRTGTVAHSTGL